MRNKSPDKLFLFCLFLFMSCTVIAQNRSEIDSLKSRNLVETNKEKIVYNLNSLANLFSLSNIDSALFYVNKALELSKQIQYKEGEAEALFLQGYYLDQAGDVNKAIERLFKASELFIEIGDSSYLTACYNNLGVLYSYGTDQPKSLEYFIKAMNLAEEIEETYSLSESYSNIGSYYELLKEYGSALKYYRKGLEIDIQNNYTNNIALSHLFVGNINLEMHRTDEALIHLKNAQKLLPEISDKYREVEVFLNFADYYLVTTNIDSTKIYIEKAKTTKLHGNYPRLKADILLIQGDLYLKLKQNKEALKYYDQAFDIYEEVEDEYVLYDLYSKKAEAYAGLGWHNKAYEMLRMSYAVEESFRPQEIAKILGEFERVQAAKEEKAQILLEQELQDQQNQNEIIRYRANFQLAIFSIVILIIILGIAIYLYISKRKHGQQVEVREKELIKLNATKDKFFSIIAHDLKNPFNVLIGISDLMLKNPDVKHSEDFEQLIDGMNQTATSGYNLLENLLEWAMAQTGSIKLKPGNFSIKEIIDLNITFFAETAKSKSLTIDSANTSEVKVYADYEMVNFIIRNLINNAIKFSYPDNEIVISTQEKGKFCDVCVEDYGIGMERNMVNQLFRIENNVQRSGTANEKGTGLGLILCKEFVEKNGGKISVDSIKGKGSRFCFSLPKSK